MNDIIIKRKIGFLHYFWIFFTLYFTIINIIFKASLFDIIAYFLLSLVLVTYFIIKKIGFINITLSDDAITIKKLLKTTKFEYKDIKETISQTGFLAYLGIIFKDDTYYNILNDYNIKIPALKEELDKRL